MLSLSIAQRRAGRGLGLLGLATAQVKRAQLSPNLRRPRVELGGAFQRCLGGGEIALPFQAAGHQELEIGPPGVLCRRDDGRSDQCDEKYSRQAQARHDVQDLSLGAVFSGLKEKLRARRCRTASNTRLSQL